MMAHARNWLLSRQAGIRLLNRFHTMLGAWARVVSAFQRRQGALMAKEIGYAHVSTKTQIIDRQQGDLLAAGVRRDDLYIDHGVSGARANRPPIRCSHQRPS